MDRGSIDVISHEHDIRAALDAARASDDVGGIAAAQRLAIIPDVPVVINVEELAGALQVTPTEVTLTATAFEILRFRLGRHSLQHMLDLRWIGDPTPYTPQLFVFGPAIQPVIE